MWADRVIRGSRGASLVRLNLGLLIYEENMKKLTKTLIAAIAICLAAPILAGAVTLRSGGQHVLGCTSEDNIAALYRSMAAGDRHGIAELIMSDACVGIENGSRAITLDGFISWRKVRVISGAYTGRMLWVAASDAR